MKKFISLFTLLLTLTTILAFDANAFTRKRSNVADFFNDGAGGATFTGFSLVGNVYSSGLTSVGTGGWCALSSTRVVEVHGNGDCIQAYDWDGTDWTTEGNCTALTADTDYDVACMDSDTVTIVEAGTLDNLEMWSYSAPNWSQDGSGTAVTAGNDVVICALSSTTIALWDSTNDALEHWTWGGSTFSQDGSGTTITGNNADIACLDSTDVAILLASNELETWSWGGSSWSQVGNSLTLYGSTGGGSRMDNLDADSIVTHLTSNAGADDGHLIVADFDGTDWTLRTEGYSQDSGRTHNVAAMDASTFVLYTGEPNIRTVTVGEVSDTRGAISLSSTCGHWSVGLSDSYDTTSGQVLSNLDSTPCVGSQTDWDFRFGDDDSATTDDPIVSNSFSGTAQAATTGSMGNYIEFDGSADFLEAKDTDNSMANATVFEDIHTDDTDDFWISILAWHTNTGGGANKCFWGSNNDAAANIGFAANEQGDQLELNQSDGTTNTELDTNISLTQGSGWLHYIVSIDTDATTNNVRYWVNGSLNTLTLNYNATTSASAWTRFIIGACPNGATSENNHISQNDFSIKEFAIGNTFLSDGTDIDTIYDQMMLNNNMVRDTN